MAKGKIKIDRERCKGCHLCLAVCPKKVIEKDSSLNRKGYQPVQFRDNGNNGECNACTMCALVCPEVAIEVYRGK